MVFIAMIRGFCLLPQNAQNHRKENQNRVSVATFDIITCMLLVAFIFAATEVTAPQKRKPKLCFCGICGNVVFSFFCHQWY
jgi:Na+-translocating ferredoxin:NAD+ oxidoreductase RnfD subunit